MRPIIQILANILGEEDFFMIYREIFSMFALMMKPRVVLDIPTYLENFVNNQFMSFSLTGSFRFPSYSSRYTTTQNFGYI